MRLVVPAAGDSLDATAGRDLGRCLSFVVIDIDTMAWQAVANRSSEHAPRPELAAAQAIVNLGADAVVAGNCGGETLQFLVTAGLDVFTGVFDTVRDAAQAVTSGRVLPMSARGTGPSEAAAATTIAEETGGGSDVGHRRHLSDGGQCPRRMAKGRGCRRAGPPGTGANSCMPPGNEGTRGEASKAETLDSLRTLAGALEDQLAALRAEIEALEEGE